MSNIFPPRHKIAFETDGEEKVYELILSQLPSDWYIFYEPSISGRKPDFILLNKDFGIIILEVKDYTIKTITKMDHFYWTIDVNGSPLEIKSPLKQCENYRDRLIALLESENQLKSKGNIYKNKLKFPIIPICVFPNLNNNDVKSLFLYELINENQLIDASDLENISQFFSKVESARNNLFIPQPLTNKDIRLISKRIYPIIEISKSKKDKSKKTRQEHDFTTINHHTFTDEISQVVDLIAHKINYNNASFSDICIILNEKRASSHSAKKYLKTLQNTLNFKNYPYSKINYPNSNGITIATYQKLKENFNLSNYHYLFFIDFNNVLTSKLRAQINHMIERLSNTHSITITTNRPFEININ